MISFERYHEFFAVPGMATTVTSSIAGRMPIGISGLAILLFVQDRADSFALGGLASALYVLGLALVAPFLGRLIDRLGPRPVLAVCAVAYPAALVLLALLVLGAASPMWICAAAVLAGATLPPISACTRALYPRLIGDPALLQTAYSIDSALVEAVFILGPALVAVCVAIGHTEAAIFLAAFASGGGTVFFMRAPDVRRWTAVPGTRARRDWIGVLRHRGLLSVYGVTLLYSFAFGLFEVAVTAHAAAKGAPAVAGIALALASVGSGVGALVYGSRHWRASLRLQFVAGLVAMTGGMLLLAPIDDLALYAMLSLAAGIPMATVIATQSLIVSRLTPRERLAEGFTWGMTCLLVGISAGIAAGGVLAEQLAPWWLLVIAGGSTALAAACAAFLKT
jgi:MFS family permease